MPSPTGRQSETVSIQPDGGAHELVFRVFQEDGGLLLEREQTALVEATFEFDLPEPGYFVLEAAVRCGGTLLVGSRDRHPVYEPLAFPHTLPRACARLTRLSPDLLECDGVVLTREGAVAPGYLASAQSRPVVFDGGFVRWLREGRSLRLEADGEVFSTTLDAGVSWVAARDFTLLGADTLVVRVDAGLATMPFDAGGQRTGELCAAVSDERGQAVLLCAETYLVSASGSAPDLLTMCLLTHDAASGGVGQCGRAGGEFLRQEGGGRALTWGSQLGWLDLFSAYTSFAPGDRSSRWGKVRLEDAQYGLSPLLYEAAEAQVLLTRESSRAWLSVPRGTRASSELAWHSDGGSTQWADLP